MELSSSRINRTFSIKWCAAILLALSLMLPNPGNVWAAETLAQAPTLLSVPVGNLTLNGIANADIYISSTASDLETFAVQEFKDTINKVSGADIVQATDLSSQLLHIILGTPVSLPEITNLFPDDLAALADSDGFAIRMTDNRIYIIGTEAKGVLNGVYDFLEENTGILWTRGVEQLGTLYDFQPTLPITKVNYREKSPFDLRGWNACGQGSTGAHHVDAATRYMEGRNKQNIRAGIINREIGNIYIDGMIATTNGMLPFGTSTTLSIDKYFDTHPEYFMTKSDGTPFKSQYGGNLNFYSAEAADALASEIAAYSTANKVKYVGHSIQDNQYFMMVEDGVDLASLPFTADNGVTVYPGDANYKSTVFFNFLNRVASKVKTLNPDIRIVSLAYIYCEYAPAVEIEDNIIIQFAPIYSNDHLPIETSASNAQTKQNLETWALKTSNIVVYNYYGSMQGTIYSRPIAKKVQADLQYYAGLGLLGLTPEGVVDSSDPQYYTNATWNMNNLDFWLINKLFWDPYADLDALTADFCRKAYGDASTYMLQYYNLIQQGWDMYDDYVWYATGGDTYIKKFIIDAGIADAATEALENAYNAADNLQKQRILPIKTTFAEQLAKYANFVSEDGKAYQTSLGKDVLVSDENLNFTTGPWSEVTPLTVFKGQNMEDVHRGIQVRLMWDNDNLYVAYKVPDVNILNPEEFKNNGPDLNADGSWWLGGPEFMETYIAGNMANLSEYSAYYTDVRGQQIQYNAGVVFQQGPYLWESHTKAITSDVPEERYWANVLVIPFSSLNVTAQTARVGGTFIANIYGGTSPYYGWCGSNVWSTAGFRPIELVSASNPTDTVPPVTTANLQGTAGQNGWYTSDVAVTLTATDDSNSVASTVYSLDGGTNWTSYTVPVVLTEDGAYNLQYYSVDGAGNVEGVKTAAVNIDRTPPIVTIDPYNTAQTYEDITVTAHTNEGILNAESHTFTENGSFDFIATDAAGNVTTETVTISNIDKTTYTIELSRFGIKNDGTLPDETSNGINAALQFAKGQGFTKIIFPTGTYLIKETIPIVIDLQNTTIDLNGSTLQINTNGLDKYSIVQFVDGADNCRLTNGIIRGDRDTHDYVTIKSSHEWGCGIVLKSGKNLQIDNITVTNVPGYGISTESGIGSNRFYALKAKDTVQGSISDDGSLIVSTTTTRTIPYDISVCGGEFEIGYTLGYQGYPQLFNRPYTSYFYDSNMNFIQKTECEQFRKVSIPNGAKYVRFVFPQASVTDSAEGAYAWLSNFRPPRYVNINNCSIIGNRSLGMAVCGGQQLTIENNTFENNGGNAPGYAVDFEDGWELMQDIFFRNNKFINNYNDLVVCAGDNLVFEGNEFTKAVYIWERTTDYKFIGNKFNGGSATYKIKREGCEISGNQYTNSTAKTESFSSLTFTLSNETFNNSGGYFAPGTKLINCALKTKSSMSNANMENCTIEISAGEMFNLTLKNCAVSNSFMNLHTQQYFESCEITNSTFVTHSDTANIKFNGCTLTNSQMQYSTWGSASDITVEQCNITMSTNIPVIKLSAGKTKGLTFKDNTVVNQIAQPVINMYDATYSIPNGNIVIEGNNFTVTNNKYVFDGVNITQGIVNFTARNNTITGAAEMLNPKYTGNQYFNIIECDPTRPVTITVAANPADVQVNNPVTITVNLKNQANDNMPNERIDWSLTSGTGNFSSSYSNTDANGNAVVTFTPTAPGTITVKAAVYRASSVNSTINISAYVSTKAVVSDTFTRANSTTALGNSETGQAWQALSGTWGIIDNKAYNAGGTSNAIAVIDSAYSDATIQCTFPVYNSVTKLIFRLTDTNNFYCVTGGYLYKVSGGTWTSLGTFTSPVNGDTVKVVLSGDSISLSVNGVQKLQVSNAFNVNATRHGISANNTTPRFDNFTVITQ